MTQDEIIEMARQAGVRDDERIFEFSQYKYLERFVNLVAAKATEEANAKANASWTLMCKKMVAIEREACANVCDDWPNGRDDVYSIGQAIRARGEQALAQPEQEPVAYWKEHAQGLQRDYDSLLADFQAQRSESSGKPSAWIGLTDEEYTHITDTVFHTGQGLVAYYKAIEAKLREKNSQHKEKNT